MYSIGANMTQVSNTLKCLRFVTVVSQSVLVLTLSAYM